ncbi:MAG: hypothetical protein ABSF44_03675 [Candidatus Bathyarchaeia archaeon]|jgi:hypothetical protein
MSDLGIGKSAALELAINRGLFELHAISKEDFELLDIRYRRKLIDIIAENKAERENTHLPKLELEKQKREKLQTLAHQVIPKEKLESAAVALKGIYENWDLEPYKNDLSWKIRQLAYAKKYPENEFAKLIIAKEGSAI